MKFGSAESPTQGQTTNGQKRYKGANDIKQSNGKRSNGQATNIKKGANCQTTNCQMTNCQNRYIEATDKCSKTLKGANDKRSKRANDKRLNKKRLNKKRSNDKRSSEIGQKARQKGKKVPLNEVIVYRGIMYRKSLQIVQSVYYVSKGQTIHHSI